MCSFLTLKYFTYLQLCQCYVRIVTLNIYSTYTFSKYTKIKNYTVCSVFSYHTHIVDKLHTEINYCKTGRVSNGYIFGLLWQVPFLAVTFHFSCASVAVVRVHVISLAKYGNQNMSDMIIEILCCTNN